MIAHRLGVHVFATVLGIAVTWLLPSSTTAVAAADADLSSSSTLRRRNVAANTDVDIVTAMHNIDEERRAAYEPSNDGDWGLPLPTAAASTTISGSNGPDAPKDDFNAKNFLSGYGSKMEAVADRVRQSTPHPWLSFSPASPHDTMSPSLFEDITAILELPDTDAKDSKVTARAEGETKSDEQQPKEMTTQQWEGLEEAVASILENWDGVWNAVETTLTSLGNSEETASDSRSLGTSIGSMDRLRHGIPLVGADLGRTFSILLSGAGPWLQWLFAAIFSWIEMVIYMSKTNTMATTSVVLSTGTAPLSFMMIPLRLIVASIASTAGKILTAPIIESISRAIVEFIVWVSAYYMYIT